MIEVNDDLLFCMLLKDSIVELIIGSIDVRSSQGTIKSKI